MAAVASGVMATTGGVLTCPEYRENRTLAKSPPLRLTRRGRFVVTGVSALLVALLSMGLATAAQATRHAGPPGPGRYITKVVVQPGQNLWSLVEAYAPNADPRQEIAQVLQLNSLTSDQIWPGQVLWLPKG
jgi:hypothetical protein